MFVFIKPAMALYTSRLNENPSGQVLNFFFFSFNSNV